MFPAIPPTRVYPIVDADLCLTRGRDPRDVALACVRGGARLLQLRVKRASSAAFLSLADDVVRAAEASGATIIVNDRPDIARLAGAGGVHVGQDDLPPERVRTVMPDGLIGLSTHDEGQVDAALQSAADHIAVGPIFGTATKDTGYDARGLGLVQYAAGRGKPVVAIGGITLARAAAVVDAGAAAVAVISDVLVEDVEARVRAYVRALDGRQV